MPWAGRAGEVSGGGKVLDVTSSSCSSILSLISSSIPSVALYSLLFFILFSFLAFLPFVNQICLSDVLQISQNQKEKKKAWITIVAVTGCHIVTKSTSHRHLIVHISSTSHGQDHRHRREKREGNENRTLLCKCTGHDTLTRVISLSKTAKQQDSRRCSRRCSKNKTVQEQGKEKSKGKAKKRAR